MKEKEKRGGKKPYRNLRVIKFQSYVIHSEYIFIGTFETLRGNSSLGISHNRHAYINRAHISHLTISTQQEKERERETCPLSITRDFITICNRTSPKFSVNRTLHDGTRTINLSRRFLSATDCRNCSSVKMTLHG